MTKNSTYRASKPRYEILDGLRGVAAMLLVDGQWFQGTVANRPRVWNVCRLRAIRYRLTGNQVPTDGEFPTDKLILPRYVTKKYGIFKNT